MTPSHAPRDLIATISTWAMVRHAIRAVLLTSTRAVPNAPVDVLSDYDVILIVHNIQPFVTDRTWLNDFGEVLVAYWDPIYPNPDFNIAQCGNVTQYVDALKIDFTLWPVALFEQIVAAPTLPAELDAGYRVLLDKDQLTATMQPPTFSAYVPKPPTNTEYQTLINDFLSSAPYVAKCLWRDDLLPAKWVLDFDMKHPFLRQLLDWRIALDYNWGVPARNLGKGLKQRLPADIWTALEQTYVGADIADNWDALARTMVLFRQLGIEVGTQLGYTYPDDLHQRVCAYVDQIKQLPPRRPDVASSASHAPASSPAVPGRMPR